MNVRELVDHFGDADVSEVIIGLIAAVLTLIGIIIVVSSF